MTRHARTAMACLLLALAGGAAAQNINIAINETGANPDPKALLDVSSTTKGLLIPRLTQAQMNAMPAPASLPQSLLVYRTDGDPGFMVVQGGAWQPLIKGKMGWDIYGNFLANNADPSPDFIGTTDNRPMFIRTNSANRVRIEASNGFVAVGAASSYVPTERLDIQGALGQYYEPTGSNRASNTAAAGVIRFQPFGAVSGTAPYRYGSRELAPVNPNNAATQTEVYGVGRFYPLQYAGHWGNVTGQDTVRGRVIGTVPHTIIQPDHGGWRALENPYEEVHDANWTHFKEAVCTPNTTVELPSGATSVMSNDVSVGAANGALASPYNYPTGAFIFLRRQYLFRVNELNVELAQAQGNNSVIGGLCPGKAITQIAFYVNIPTVTRQTLNQQAHVVVRNAPLGLEELVGFDNTPDNSGTMGCGSIPVGTWPDATGGHWHNIPLNISSFVWDGMSNVIVEVAVRIGAGLPSTPTHAPVLVSQTVGNTTYAASFTGASIPNMVNSPYPDPGWACTNLMDPTTGNTQLRMPDVDASPLYTSGATSWRPVIQFKGEVASLSGAATTGTSKYINYTGAIIMEDPASAGRLNVLSPGFPWGRWRMNFPAGYSTFNYKGNGTISAQKGIYDNRVRLNDHVFDRTFDGRVAPQEAAEFGRQRILSMEEMAAFTKQNRHLPTMKGREEWNRSDGFSLGDLTNQLWTTAETHALYVTQLHDKLNVLEILATERLLNPAEFGMASGQLANMPEYSDAEKVRLIQLLRERTPALGTSH